MNPLIRSLLLSLSLAACALPTFATEVAKKGAEPGQWTMDFEAASKLAKDKNLPMLLNFTGSDWCGWCKLMDEAVYAKKEWVDYAATNLVLVTVDFPNDKSIVPEEFVARNGRLQEQFGVQGYPTYVLLDSDATTELGRLGAGEDKTPVSFIGEVNDLLRFRPANIEAKVAALGPEKGAQYKSALDAVSTVEKELMEWLQTRPQRNPENDAKFEAFQAKIADAHKAVAAF